MEIRADQPRGIHHGDLLVVKEQAVQDLHPAEVVDGPAMVLCQHIERREAVDVGGRGDDGPGAGDEGAALGELVPPSQMAGKERDVSTTCSRPKRTP